MKKVYVGNLYERVEGEYVKYSRRPSEHQFIDAMASSGGHYANETFKSESYEEAKAWFEEKKSKLEPAYIMEGVGVKYYMGSYVELDVYTEDEDGELDYYESCDSAESVYIEEEDEDEDEEEEDED